MMRVLDQSRAIMERFTLIETSLAKIRKFEKATVTVSLELNVSYFQLSNHATIENRIHERPLTCIICFYAFSVEFIIFTL